MNMEIIMMKISLSIIILIMMKLSLSIIILIIMKLSILLMKIIIKYFIFPPFFKDN